jgi:hypothetical protein
VKLSKLVEKVTGVIEQGQRIKQLQQITVDDLVAAAVKQHYELPRTQKEFAPFPVVYGRIDPTRVYQWAAKELADLDHPCMLARIAAAERIEVMMGEKQPEG